MQEWTDFDASNLVVCSVGRVLGAVGAFLVGCMILAAVVGQ
jgi:hypothetical protein